MGIAIVILLAEILAAEGKDDERKDVFQTRGDGIQYSHLDTYLGAKLQIKSEKTL